MASRFSNSDSEPSAPTGPLAHTIGHHPSRDPECGICLEVIDPQEQAVTHISNTHFGSAEQTEANDAGCLNAWHNACIEEWLLHSQMSNCPACRRQLDNSETAQGAVTDNINPGSFIRDPIQDTLLYGIDEHIERLNAIGIRLQQMQLRLREVQAENLAWEAEYAQLRATHHFRELSVDDSLIDSRALGDESHASYQSQALNDLSQPLRDQSPAILGLIATDVFLCFLAETALG